MAAELTLETLNQAIEFLTYHPESGNRLLHPSFWNAGVLIPSGRAANKTSNPGGLATLAGVMHGVGRNVVGQLGGLLNEENLPPEIKATIAEFDQAIVDHTELGMAAFEKRKDGFWYTADGKKATDDDVAALLTPEKAVELTELADRLKAQLNALPECPLHRIAPGTRPIDKIFEHYTCPNTNGLAYQLFASSCGGHQFADKLKVPNPLRDFIMGAIGGLSEVLKTMQKIEANPFGYLQNVYEILYRIVA